MKIFFEERFIELLDSQPDNAPAGAHIVEFKSEERFPPVLNDFLDSPGSFNLMIWSKINKEDWQRQFFTLFHRIDAAGGIVRNEKGEILFIFRLGKWDLPKGKLNTGETPENGAIREVREETGLHHMEIIRSLPPTFHIYQRKGRTILKRTWWFEMSADSEQPLFPEAKEDISEAVWVGLDKRSEVVGNTYGSIRELLGA